MKKFRFLFNVHTLAVVVLSLLCSFLSLQYQIRLYIDFIFLGLFIAFPLTFTLKEAFKRRERALQYLSTFNAALRSAFYYCENSRLEPGKKLEFKKILINISFILKQYLANETDNASAVQKTSDEVFQFLQANKANLKAGLSEKIFSIQYRINECIVFLLSTKRHHTPCGVRIIILFAVYAFVICYPASLLGDKGFDVPLWYVFAMTAFKSLILISLCNVQQLLEDPFNQDNPDSARLDDFQFTGLVGE